MELTNGNLAVVWSNNLADVRLRVLDSTGNSGVESVVNSTAYVGYSSKPQVTSLANGGFVVTWDTPNNPYPGDSLDQRARIFDANGIASGDDFLVNSSTAGLDGVGQIASLSSGGFVIVWIAKDAGFVRGQVFDGLGGRVGSEFTVDGFADVAGDDSGYLGVTGLADGRFVVTWTGPEDAASGIYSQIFDPRDGVVNGTHGSDVLYGNDALNDEISGYNGADNLFGMKGDDALNGGADADMLNGGLGADVMTGGLGDDTYIVDNAGDEVIEANVTGIDTVNSSVTFSLAGNYVEKLTLTGAAAINATGNSFNNTIVGNSAANVINGGGGADKMTGGAGNDIYTVDNVGDVVIEANVTGVDLVNSSVTFSLAGQYTENLTLTGSTAINGTGNSSANAIIGNSGANVISGGTNIDKLTGGAGADTFVFNAALGASNVDTITDFKVVDDTIRLDDAVFTKLSVGTLSSAAFFSNLTGTAHDGDDRIIYESDSGKLFYDADGTGATAGVHFATVAIGLVVTNADFVIV